MRLWFLKSLVGYVGVGRLFELSWDMRNYIGAAEAILREWRWDHLGVVTFGPGYPATIALAGAAFDLQPVPILILQILLSSVTPVLVGLIAEELTGRRLVGLVAASLSAVSLLSILFASFLWSETLFVFCVSASLLALLRGLAKPRRWLSILSGLLLGWAILPRSMRQLMPVACTLIAAINCWSHSNRTRRLMSNLLAGPLPAAAIALLMSGGWLVHNNLAHGLPTIALATPHGMAKIARLTELKVVGTPLPTIDSAFAAKIQDHPAASRRRFQAFYEVSTAEFARVLGGHPTGMVSTIAANAWINMTMESTPSHFPTHSATPYRQIIGFLRLPHIFYRGIVLTFIGGLILALRKQFKALLTLLTLYAYFAAVGAFAVDQGSRIFYPSQIASCVLMAVALVGIWDLARMGVMRLRRSDRADRAGP